MIDRIAADHDEHFTPSPDSQSTKRYRLKPHEAKIIDALRGVDETPRGNVLVIGDTHIPFELPGYLDFCVSVSRHYHCSQVVHIGDIVDSHASSYHEADPDGYGAGHELAYALGKLKRWYKAFPRARVCLGNHDRIAERKAFSAGLPRQWLKSFKDALEMPAGWEVDEQHVINGVLYRHQGGSGVNPAYNYALENGVSTVMGHTHTARGLRDCEQHDRYLFGLDTGCGVDPDSYAQAYAKNNRRPMKHGCGVVVNEGQMAISVRMPEEFR